MDSIIVYSAIYLAVGIIIAFLFVIAIRYWITKKQSLLPVIIYWIFGFLFVLYAVQASTIHLLLIAINASGKQFISMSSVYGTALMVGLGAYLFAGGWLYNMRLKLKKELSKTSAS